MAVYVVYITVALAYAALFLWAGGGFRAAAGKLLLKMPGLGPAVTRDAMALSLMILFAANVLGAAATCSSRAGIPPRRGI